MTESWLALALSVSAPLSPSLVVVGQFNGTESLQIKCRLFRLDSTALRVIRLSCSPLFRRCCGRLKEKSRHVATSLASHEAPFISSRCCLQCHFVPFLWPAVGIRITLLPRHILHNRQSYSFPFCFFCLLLLDWLWKLPGKPRRKEEADDDCRTTFSSKMLHSGLLTLSRVSTTIKTVSANKWRFLPSLKESPFSV